MTGSTPVGTLCIFLGRLFRVFLFLYVPMPRPCTSTFPNFHVCRQTLGVLECSCKLEQVDPVRLKRTCWKLKLQKVPAGWLSSHFVAHMLAPLFTGFGSRLLVAGSVVPPGFARFAACPPFASTIKRSHQTLRMTNTGDSQTNFVHGLHPK